MKKIIISGVAGFLGSHLCDKLMSLGNYIIGIDNLYTGKEKNISHLIDNINFKFIYHDLIDPIKFDADEIYNLACPASPPQYQKDPIRTFKTSILGSLNLLEEARRLNAKIFQASTSEIYGDPEISPQTESYRGLVNTIGVRACYDEGKRGAETLFFDFHRFYNIKIKVVRIFNTYGPRMDPDDGRVISNFVTQALLGHPITIYGNGEQTRSFCYCDDLIDALVLMMNTSDTFTGPINIGNPNEFTIIELAELVQDIIGKKSKIIYKPLPMDDPRQRRPDISLAQKELGWTPKIQLPEGLRRTAKYFDELFSRGMVR
ncbi:MAG: SDR family oxidoreductase [Deltaproteobacteria bacterium]|jgi:UDP-glucuronate decarboxylase|nr:SDR family oxidoreductase [Deltaproteobacteria bacterium]